MSKSKRKMRHKNRRMRELAEMQRQSDRMRAGHKFGRDVLAAADKAVAKTSLPPSLAPMLAMGAVSLAKRDMPSLKDMDFGSAIAAIGQRLLADVISSPAMQERLAATPADDEEAARWHEDER